MARTLSLGLPCALMLLAGCPETRTCTYAQCDIRDPGCQAEVWDSVQCARGAPEAAMPAIEVIDNEAFRNERATSVETLPTRGPEWDRVMQTLRIVSSALTIDQQLVSDAPTTTVAYYSPADEIVRVVDRGTGMQSAMHVSVLARSLAYAADDREYGTTEYIAAGADTDAKMAREAATFGALDVIMLDYAINLATPNTIIRWDETFAASIENARAQGPSRYAAARKLPGLLGGRAIAARWRTGETAEALRTFKSSPPVSTVEFMADPFARETSRTRVDVGCPTAAPEQAFLTAEDRLGALFLWATLNGNGANDRAAWDAARLLLGDRIEVFTDNQAETGFVWRIRTASPEHAAIVLELANSYPNPTRSVHLDDSDVLFIGASEESLFARLESAVDISCEE